MDIRRRFREWRACGFSELEAGNLVAWQLGLGPVEHGWTIRELLHLAFVAELDEREPDVTAEADRANRRP